MTVLATVVAWSQQKGIERAKSKERIDETFLFFLLQVSGTDFLLIVVDSEQFFA